MNVRDTESVDAALQQAGYDRAEGEHDARLIIVNSCSVRGKAEDKAVGKLGMLCAPGKKPSDRLVGVMGCMVQRMGEEIFSRVPALDFAVGTHRHAEIPQIIERLLAGGRPILANDFDDGRREVLRGHLPGAVSSFVTILLGCDRRCTYCIVPDVRGKEYSRPALDIETEVLELVKTGVREVTLLGQSVMNYGLRNTVFTDDAPPSPTELTEPLPRLLERLASVEGLKRLRFTSGHPSGCTPQLIAVMRDNPKVCAHLHLPFQSGSDTVLKRMRRGYLRTDYLAAVQALRENIPHVALSTDVIVGFPGETEEDFKATRSLMQEADFDNAFIFKYSPRPGTPAAAWKDDVPEAEKKERNQILLADQDQRGLKINEGYIGQRWKVLVEGPSRRNTKKWSGRTETNKIVIFEPESEIRTGELIECTIDRAMPQTLYGTPTSD